MNTPAPFDDEQRRLLERYLGTKQHEQAPLSYPQAAGFLYAMAAGPHLVPPSEWLESVLGENPPEVDDFTEYQHFIGALMSLSNFAAEQVFSDAPEFPPGCKPPADPAAAFGPNGAFGQWAEGLLNGHVWLTNDWDAALTDEQSGMLGLAMTMLTGFADRQLAEEIIASIAEENEASETDEALPSTADEWAEMTLPLVDHALGGYMGVAREIREATIAPKAMASREPYRRDEPRVGRNEPCPCGSGRKYKRCCGQRLH